MRTYWVTLVSVSAVLFVVGLLVGGLMDTATDDGTGCGAPFGGTTDYDGSELYGPECTGVRAQAKQLPTTLLLLGGSGLAGAAIGGYVVRRRAQVGEPETASEV